MGYECACLSIYYSLITLFVTTLSPGNLFSFYLYPANLEVGVISMYLIFFY